MSNHVLVDSIRKPVIVNKIIQKKGSFSFSFLDDAAAKHSAAVWKKAAADI
jgi:hypothetical protein